MRCGNQPEPGAPIIIARNNFILFIFFPKKVGIHSRLAEELTKLIKNTREWTNTVDMCYQMILMDGNFLTAILITIK